MQIHQDIRFQNLIERMEALLIEDRQDEMRLLLEQLQTLAETEQDDIGLAAAYFYRDVLCGEKPGSESYMQYAKRALKIADAKNITYYQMKVNNSLGIMYSENSDFHTSLEYYLNAIHIAEEHPEYSYASVVLNNVGNLFVWLEEYKEASSYLERAYHKAISENKDDKQLLATIGLNLIELYSSLGDYEKAKTWEEESCIMCYREVANIIECINMINPARQLLENGKHDEAAEALSKFASVKIDDSDYIYTFRCCVNALRMGIELNDFPLCTSVMKTMETLQSGTEMTSFSYEYATVRVEYYQAFKHLIKDDRHSYYEDYYMESQKRIEQLRSTYARSLSVKIALEEIKDENKSVHLKNEQLQKDIERDIFTNLYNKVSTEKYVREAMHGLSKGKKQGLMLIDIDLFKRINDCYGHGFGDKVITLVAETIESMSQGPKIAGRFGGDEFLVFLDRQDDYISIKNAAEGLLSRVRSGIELPDNRVDKITLSIGICLIDAPMEFEKAFASADEALYKAKELGRNRCEFSN